MSQVTAFVTPQKQDSRDGSIGDDGASEEAAADEDNGGKKQPARAPSKEDGPPVWIKKDVKLLATMSRKSFPSKAICLSDPVKGEDNEWFIDVEWLESCSNWRDRVKCVHCLQISSDAHPKRSRKVRDLSEKSLAESPLPKKKQPRHSRSKPNDQPPTNYTNNAEEDDRKSAARETNQRVIQAAREKTIRSVDMLHKKYSNGMIHKALDKVGFPFGIQDTAGELRELARQKKLKEDAEKIHDGRQPFKVRKGTTIRKSWQDGIGYDGIVKDANPKKKLLDGEKEMVDVWRVEYDTGVFEDMTKAEIRQWRFPRPELPLCLGRKFNFLEVFSGQGVVSNAFADRGWSVASIDKADTSNATIKKDICDVDFSTLPFVPDCMWLSPDCTTYSHLAGGAHRVVSRGELARSPVAKEQDEVFCNMVRIMSSTLECHPHSIFIIENPASGSLKDLPLMKQTVEDFALRDVVVDYCAFGRPEQKSTRLWSNSPLLLEHLRDFRCETSCTQMKNHKAVKGRTEESNSKIIPQPLAETVARFVDSDLFLKGIQKTKAAFPGQILNSTYV